MIPSSYGLKNPLQDNSSNTNSMFNYSPHQIIVPQAVRPIPHFQRGNIRHPKILFNKFFDFSNYSNKIIERVNQHPR